LRGWLFGIAHNVSLNLLRQRGSEHEQLDAYPGTEEPAHTTFERREHFRNVLAAVAALPPSQRDAIVLRELEGRGHEEIARELGVTGGAARQLISRARSGIREAAAAILPMPLLMRLTAGTAPAPTAERVTELTAVGGGVAVSKVVATGAIGATLLGGAVAGPDLIEGKKDRQKADVAEAATPPKHDAAPAEDPAGRGPGSGSGEARTSDDISGPSPGDDDGGTDNSGPGDRDGDDDGSGPAEDGDDRSGPGPGSGDGDGDGDDVEVEVDNSGPGSGEDRMLETDSSGPGSGDDAIETDSSGPGGGDGGETEILSAR
jgi:hypothetical protein